MEAPLKHANFNLNIGGIVGFLGGEEAISAMESMHFYRYRKWLGWYNSPGSYTIAKHYGRLARSRIWDGIYPGPNDEPAKLLGMDGEQGPPYRGIISGTALNDTGHVGHVFAQYCHNLATSEHSSNSVVDESTTSNSNVINAKSNERTTKVMNVIIVDFEEKASNKEGSDLTPLALGDTKSPLRPVAIALVPISLNIACCILCGLYREWYAFGVILYGILCNGIACYFIGSAEVFLKHPSPSPYSPPGNGILEYKSDTLIVCRGSERAINHVVKGKFVVRYGKEGKDVTYHKIGFSAISLTTQFIGQLFLIPISDLFGQIMFLSTLAISWIYNAYLSSIDKERLQQQLLIEHLPLRDVDFTMFHLPTRTSAVVFAVLCGLPDLQGDSDADAIVKCARGITNHLLPSDTDVWGQWQTLVSLKIRELSKLKKNCGEPPLGLFGFTEQDYQEFQGNKDLLKDLLDDAHRAYESYYRWCLNPAARPNTPSGSQSKAGV